MYYKQCVGHIKRNSVQNRSSYCMVAGWIGIKPYLLVFKPNYLLVREAILKIKSILRLSVISSAIYAIKSVDKSNTQINKHKWCIFILKRKILFLLKK